MPVKIFFWFSLSFGLRWGPPWTPTKQTLEEIYDNEATTRSAHNINNKWATVQMGVAPVHGRGRAHCVANWPNWPWLSVFYAPASYPERKSEKRRWRRLLGSATCGCNCGIMPKGPNELDSLALYRTWKQSCLSSPPTFLALFFYVHELSTMALHLARRAWGEAGGAGGEPQLRFTTIWVKRFDSKKLREL